MRTWSGDSVFSGGFTQVRRTSTHAARARLPKFSTIAPPALPSGLVGPIRKQIPDERAVIERAARGDRRAFEKIYRAYAPILYGYVLVPMLGDHDDAH
ncbi:MAG: RNA polymerase sigma factor, partial [Nannocystaceae bacterium]